MFCAVLHKKKYIQIMKKHPGFFLKSWIQCININQKVNWIFFFLYVEKFEILSKVILPKTGALFLSLTYRFFTYISSSYNHYLPTLSWCFSNKIDTVGSRCVLFVWFFYFFLFININLHLCYWKNAGTFWTLPFWCFGTAAFIT